jgi:hypothetical protein
LTIRGNRFERALPCAIGRIRCGHQDLIELFGRRRLRVEDNYFGVYEVGGAQLIDRATRRYSPPTDITGRSRGSAPDIGAYEYRGG